VDTAQRTFSPEVLVAWYRENARDLPWRRPGTSAWAVLVSEFMLQQTPVSRVLPAWQSWVTRWPAPVQLAAEPAAEAVRAWGRLGYPRRALRLHQCAVAITGEHCGVVPDDLDTLLSLPGVGAYTARAVLAFAYRQRAAPVDVNVCRVLARVVSGRADAGTATTARDFALLEELLPDNAELAAQTCTAMMELGATVCTARTPRCAQCPVTGNCAWRAVGYPAYQGPPKRRQAYEGTDRQARGRILALLRESPTPVHAEELANTWHEADQQERALSSLLTDGLVVPKADGHFTLPE
jgi:A/G-specific adenine glycosylase